jgi:uncharacterized protein
VADTLPSRPLPDTRNAGGKYWQTAAEGALLLPKCLQCGKAFWHPRPRCPHCGSANVDWIKSAGRGSIHTFTVVRQSGDPFFKGKLPYSVAMVELDEGPRMMSNIVQCAPDELAIGMRVAVTFEPAAEGIAIPLFRPESKA